MNWCEKNRKSKRIYNIDDYGYLGVDLNKGWVMVCFLRTLIDGNYWIIMEGTGSFSIKGNGKFRVVSAQVFVVEQCGLVDGDSQHHGLRWCD